MIIEPYSGEKITRVISINSEEEMTRDEFLSYAYTYLCMSNKEILSSKNIAQLYHTTYQTFKNSVNYAITGDEKIELNGYTKNNLASISKSGYEPKL